MAKKLCDDSGYEVTFEEEIPESEKKLYLTIYPLVDKVAERRIHCTSCNSHIGTAPNAEARIRMHPVLKVTHCRNCHSFYNSGEFDKGEDGSELYCRWCGQGGEVYCCSSCPYVFCKKCITQNFSRSMITEIERQDNWECFSCSPQILFNLRAQHWALTNFIEKQIKEIRAANYPSDEYDERMAKDSTTCCRRKSEVAKKPTLATAKKRPASPVKGPAAKKPPERVFRASTLLGGGTSAPSLATKTQPARAASSSLVCSPDILSMFSDDPPEVAISPPQPRITISTQPTQRPIRPAGVPPLAIRQYVGGPSGVRAQIRPQQSTVPMVQISTTQGTRPVSYQRQTQASAGAPVYHTINGYRIDLNTAAQQETFRLPNGKMIQVKKQAPQQQVSNVQRTPAQIVQRNAIGQAVNNVSPYTTVRYQPPQQQQRVMNGNVQNQMTVMQQTYQQPQMQPIPQIRPPAQGLPLKPPPCLLMKPSHPPTPLGIARNAFEFKVYNSLEVCHQIIGKINTLSNYPSYKTVNHVSELKDLYTHLSYLLSYAISRFKGVQEKCAEESKALGLDQENEKSKDKADDELEVIENQAPVIDLDSDNEDGELPQRQAEPVASKSNPSPAPSISIESIIEKIGDPKLKLIPRVEVLKAETLIPSVKELLKKERKDSTASDIEMDPQNYEQDDPMTNLLEVTPDISVMMSQEQDKETDNESVVELSDGSDTPMPINLEPLVTVESDTENEKHDETSESVVRTENIASTKENEPKDMEQDKDDAIVTSSEVTNDHLNTSTESPESEKTLEKETVTIIDDDMDENETEVSKSNEDNTKNATKEAPEDSVVTDEVLEVKDDTESNKEPEQEMATSNPEEPNPDPEESSPVEAESTEIPPEQNPESENLLTDDDSNPNEESLQSESQINDVEMTEEPQEEPEEEPLPPQTDIDMIEAQSDQTENVQNPSEDILPVSGPPDVTQNEPMERQLTLEDVELFPEPEENPEKDLNTLNKGDDLSIEDFNLGESELNDLAENLVQEGWDI